MTHRLALVLSAGEWLVAHFITGWTLAVAALSVAQVEFAVPQFLAFGLASEGLYAVYFPCLEAAETVLYHYFFALEGEKKLSCGGSKLHT